MPKRNPNIEKLPGGYLFPEINKRKKLFLEKNPTAQLISLGIGDTTQPIPPYINNALVEAAKGFGTHEGYKGYPPEKGVLELRKAIAEKLYQSQMDEDEIFISDGALCDIGRLQVLFGKEIRMAVQDPSYPAYVDTSIILGQTTITYMPCTPENNFFPDLSQIGPHDLLFFCSPNNPTGAAATYKQLELLVKWAQKNRAIIIYDAAYTNFIQDPDLPKTIYEIEGAETVAIELGSFSKMVGFTGIRVAWSVFPKQLKFEDGSQINSDWNRVHSTFFNGTSHIAQAGALAALTPQGLHEMKEMTQYYLENARLLRETFTELEYEVYGGQNSPYLWVRVPGETSWNAFKNFLENKHIISTPGSGYGPSGEGFLRFSSFAPREQILEAKKRLLVLDKISFNLIIK